MGTSVKDNIHTIDITGLNYQNYVIAFFFLAKRISYSLSTYATLIPINGLTVLGNNTNCSASWLSLKQWVRFRGHRVANL